jgi:gamma-glutamyltranspeptidase / glutathione hydrolase
VRSMDGADVGGVQMILFTPTPAQQPPPPGAPILNGYYRAGSDLRKDGEAVGW